MGHGGRAGAGGGRGGGPKGLLLDTNALVYLLQGCGERQAVVTACIGLARRGGIRLMVSAIVWTELLSGVPDAEAGEYRRLLAEPGLVLTREVDVAVAETAAAVRRRWRLPLPDCIHIATAGIAGFDILGNDAAWRSCADCPRLWLVDELAFRFREMREVEDGQGFDSWLTEALKSLG